MENLFPCLQPLFHPERGWGPTKRACVGPSTEQADSPHSPCAPQHKGWSVCPTRRATTFLPLPGTTTQSSESPLRLPLGIYGPGSRGTLR